MNPTTTTPPTGAPVTLAQAKEHLKTFDDFEDWLINIQIKAATDWVEEMGKILLMPRVMAYRLPVFCQSMALPVGPVRSIVSVNYFDTDNNPQTVPAADYTLNEETNQVQLTFESEWPETYSRWDAVTLTFDAGYENKASIPPAAIGAILLLVADLYEIREAQVLGLNVNENRTLMRLVNSFKDYSVAV